LSHASSLFFFDDRNQTQGLVLAKHMFYPQHFNERYDHETFWEPNESYGFSRQKKMYACTKIKSYFKNLPNPSESYGSQVIRNFLPTLQSCFPEEY
jgi:hypothetical protein